MRPASPVSGLCAGVALALLAGCATEPVPRLAFSSPPAAGLPLYRCEQSVEFTVRFADDTAVVDGSRGREVLYRDAGGLTDRQTVYSNPRMRAEFGLGNSGREAVLRLPLQPLVLRCARD